MVEPSDLSGRVVRLETQREELERRSNERYETIMKTLRKQSNDISHLMTLVGRWSVPIEEHLRHETETLQELARKNGRNDVVIRLGVASGGVSIGGLFAIVGKLLGWW